MFVYLKNVNYKGEKRIDIKRGRDRGRESDRTGQARA